MRRRRGHAIHQTDQKYSDERSTIIMKFTAALLYRSELIIGDAIAEFGALIPTEILGL